jgi:hypothetical protein
MQHRVLSRVEATCAKILSTDAHYKEELGKLRAAHSEALTVVSERCVR